MKLDAEQQQGVNQPQSFADSRLRGDRFDPGVEAEEVGEHIDSDQD